MPPPPGATPGEIIDVAGGGTLQVLSSGIRAVTAVLSDPGGVAVDSAGDVFIADTDDNEVREVLPDGYIFTIAGNGIAGDTGNGGPAVLAELNHPEGVAVDASGDVFIADTGNNEIREVAPGGTITDYAGNGTAGYSGDGGAPASAELDAPYGVATGPGGELAIGDTDNDVARLVFCRININDGASRQPGPLTVHSAEGPHAGLPCRLVIDTIAGGGTSGYGDGGPATSAELSDPTGVAFDSSGDLFIADTGDSAIREVSNDTGDISTAAYSPYPTGVAVDSGGDVFMADPVENDVLEQPAGGSVERIAGTTTEGDSGDDGPATSAELSYPAAVAVDAYGDVFVADTGNGLVREVVAARVPYFETDTPPLDAGADQAYSYRFFAWGVPEPTYSLGGGAPSWLSISPTTGRLNGTLPSGVTSFTYSVTAASSSGTTTVGPFTVTVPKPIIYIRTGLAPLKLPVGLSETSGLAPAGALLVTDGSLDRVEKLSALGQYIAGFGSAGTTAGKFHTPTGVAMDAGDIWVVDSANNRMEEFSSSGVIIRVFGLPGHGHGQFESPSQVVFGPSGAMYVSDSGNDRIQVFTATGTYVTSFGSAGSGPGEMLDPNGLAFDSSGDLLVADSGNDRIDVFGPAGLYLGSFGSAGTKLGEFEHPFGVAVDSAGDIFVTDRFDNRVEEFSSTAEPIQQFGSAGHGSGQFESPLGIAVSASGLISVADSGNKRVEQFAEPAAPTFTTDSPPLTMAPGGTYDYQFAASGEPPPAFTLAAGAPSWLSVGPANGVVSGSPPEGTTSFSYTVVATNGSGSVDAGPFSVSVATPVGYAGQFGSYGSGNGQLFAPSGVAVGPDGDLYVVDRENNRIEVFSTSGTYLSKFGTLGSGDGELDGPYGIAFDSLGDVWVTDYNNNRVEEFSSSGSFMTTFGTAGAGDGDFEEPEGIAIDPTTNDIYVADTGNNRVEEFSDMGGFIRSFTTTNGGPLFEPTAVAVNSSGELYVGNNENGEIVGYSSSGTQNATYGGAGSGEGEFDGISGLALDANGDIWASDYANDRVTELSGTGQFLIDFGSAGSGDDELESPQGVAPDSNGIVYVADLGNDRIEEFAAPPYQLVYTGQFGSPGSTAGEFEQDSDVAIDPTTDDFYVVDHENDRIEEFSSSGSYVGDFGAPGSSDGDLDGPVGIAFTSGGDVWVTDEGNNRIEEFTAAGSYLAQFGSPGSGDGQFDSPRGIAIDPTTGDIYIGDVYNNRVQEFTSNGTFITQFTTTSYGSLDRPIAVAVNAQGELYIADYGNDMVVGFDSAGTQNLVFGGSGSAAGQFDEPSGLALDSEGNIWVTDGGNDRVEEFSSDGSYLSYFGSPGSGNGDLSLPTGLVVGSTGTVSVADLGNDRVEEFGPP